MENLDDLLKEYEIDPDSLSIFNSQLSDPNIEKKAIITFTTGKRPFFEHYKKSISRYANRIGVPYIIDRKIRSNTKNDIRANKLASIYNALSYFDRIIFLDDTCFALPSCEDLFEVVEKSSFGAFIESKIFDRKQAIDHACKRYKPFYGGNQVRSIMVNSGVLVVGKKHRDMFYFDQRTPIVGQAGQFTDQAFLSYRLSFCSDHITDLTLKYNAVGSKIYNDWISSSKNIDKFRNILIGKYKLLHVTRGAGPQMRDHISNVFCLA